METGSNHRVCIKISRRCIEGEQIKEILKGNVCWDERDNKDKERYIKDKLIANRTYIIELI